ncbi:hypothetical protein [Halomonas casei]|uniref:hypothetical protein n=1 Tax=Halomonas casei TaxID=2742613 RepID=UPI003CF146B3
MGNQLKAFLIAMPVAIGIQGALILYMVATFGEDANIGLLVPVGIVSGMVSYFTIRKHLDSRN